MRVRICIIEPTATENRRSVGSWYVQRAAESAGYAVDYITEARPGAYDVELVSLHHQLDYPHLAELPRSAPVRIIGGHPMASNPEPIQHLGDVVCAGDGETWIRTALSHLADGADIRSMSHAGTLYPDDDACVVASESCAIEHPPYLNVSSSDGHADTWYIELSRGCASKCNYCDLGWRGHARHRSYESIISALDQIDRSKSNRVSLFAPDEADHPDYQRVIDEIKRRKLITQFGSLRVDSLRESGLRVPRSFLMRFGIDGLTQETRRRVGKPISNSDIYELFRYAADIGHTNLKIFMIIGYPWETPSDFDEWNDLMHRCAMIPRKQNAHLRIKWTPLIPQPNTPLGGIDIDYPAYVSGLVNAWHARVRHPSRTPGLYISQDGTVMGRTSHAAQCALTQAGEDIRPMLTAGLPAIARAWLDGKLRKARRITRVRKPSGGIIPIDQIQRSARMRARQ